MEVTFHIHKQHKFTKLRVRMLRWANDNSKPIVGRNGYKEIPDHKDRDRSWKDDLTTVCRLENQKLTSDKIKLLNKLWRTYKI